MSRKERIITITLISILIIVTIALIVVARRDRITTSDSVIKKKSMVTTMSPAEKSRMEETQETGYGDEGAIEEYYDNLYAGQKYVYRDNGEPRDFTAVRKYTFTDISSEPQLYYFEQGIWKQDYTGLADSYHRWESGSSEDKQYYVKNGIVDSNFTGFVLDNGFHKFVKNGVFDPHRNGTFTVDGKEYSITNGVATSDFYTH